MQVEANEVPEYNPPEGTTPEAPTYGTVGSAQNYTYPPDFDRIAYYIYPYLNSTDLEASSGDTNFGGNYTWPADSSSSSPQPYLPAGSKTTPGGNERLYDVLFRVTTDITNTGDVVGDEVVQLYVSRGGADNPVRELRGFDRLTISPGETATFAADITRRDISDWDTVTQNW